MNFDITIYIEDKELKIPFGEPYEITCNKNSTATIILGD
jgi:hypothetical protein